MELQNENFDLSYYIELYGSDKKLSGYSVLYDRLFNKQKNKINSFLEIGVGTLTPGPSSFSGNIQHYAYYTPGGSLRAWRDYFPNAMVYGIDIADDCKLEEERIETFIFSSLDGVKCDEYLGALTFDIIIDDGLHTAIGQLETMKNLFHRVRTDGYYIIEDCGGGGDDKNVFYEYNNEISEFANEHEYHFRGNVLVIRKNYSKKGKIDDLNAFSPQNIMTAIVVPNTETPKLEIINNDLTVVTGLWNIGRPGREFTHYIEHFKRFLEIPIKMFIYIPKEYEYLVWEKRSKENTVVKIYELDDIKRLYGPFWEKTQDIRLSPAWLNQTGENGWLTNSPQASLEWYNPIVQSKMFMVNDVTVWNPFNTDYFIWLDAGITNTVYEKFFTEGRVLDKINPHLEQFLFLSYPYDASTEIHGFNFNAINRFADKKVEYVCRGGLFGGRKDVINQASASYYVMLNQTLHSGYMGTEESIFSILSYREPHIYRRYSLDGNGLIVKYITNLIDGTAQLEPVPEENIQMYNNVAPKPIKDDDLKKIKTNLYILTFNFPEQVQYTIDSMKKVPEWLNRPNLVLLDNSTNDLAKIKNKKIAEEYNFEYIDLGGNKGICGGRQAAATHFHNSDSDFMLFFEDDMTINSPELKGQYCRNGFRKYIPNLYDTIHKIMLKEKFDFLKLSFTEVYFDNDKQCSWYNVPQHIRTRDWPDYDKLPTSGLDPNVPLTNFKNINVMDGVAYITGEIYYANWPMIVSKEGNKKMFIDDSWAHPFEQTWMSYNYQLTKENKLKPAVLLCSPIWHERIKYYKPEERREN